MTVDFLIHSSSPHWRQTQISVDWLPESPLVVVTLTPRPWPLSGARYDPWVSGRGSCREIGQATLGCRAAMFPAEIFPRGWDRQILIWLPGHLVWHLAKRKIWSRHENIIEIQSRKHYISHLPKGKLHSTPEWQHSKERMCRLQNIAKCDYQESDYQTDTRTNRQTPDKVIHMCCYASQVTPKGAKQDVFVKHYAPAGKKTEKAILSIMVIIKVTYLFFLFERA